MRKCTNCGREYRDNEDTCIDCGGMLQWDSEIN